MIVVETIRGEVVLATKLAKSQWDFIAEWLPDYSTDTDVTLSNDCSVVLEVFDKVLTVSEYLEIPEDERDYSNAPFENVASYLGVEVSALNLKEVERLQLKIDEDLFDRAIKAYNEIKPF